MFYFTCSMFMSPAIPLSHVIVEPDYLKKQINKLIKQVTYTDF